MRPTQWIAAIAVAWPGLALAGHEGMDMSGGAAPSPDDFAASVSLVAASFETMSYSGDYQGVVPSVSWTHGPVAVTGIASLYRIYANGLANTGIGDVAASLSVTLLSSAWGMVGVMAMASAPTGEEALGFGMGHVMAMPAAYGVWNLPEVTLTGSFGYSRALVSISGDSHHDHGVWPLVDPMNMSELTWSASAQHGLTRDLRVGLRAAGGIPIGPALGHERVIGALRVAFGHGRVETAAEVQAGVVGDPFTFRGVVETALRF